MADADGPGRRDKESEVLRLENREVGLESGRTKYRVGTLESREGDTTYLGEGSGTR